MSISNVTHTSPLGMVNVARTSRTSGQTALSRPNAFAAMLESARGVEQVEAIRGHAAQAVNNSTASNGIGAIAPQTPGADGILNSSGAQFADILAQAQGQYGSNVTSGRQSSTRGVLSLAAQIAASGRHGTAINSGIQTTPGGALGSAQTIGTVEDTADRTDLAATAVAVPEDSPFSTGISADAAKVISAIEAVNAYQRSLQTEAAGTAGAVNDGNNVVNLTGKTLDFSTLLPVGMRDFVSAMRCPEHEINEFVNIMIFGSEQGPQGQDAASFFGADTMTGTELSERMASLIDHAKINSAALTSSDYNFVLREHGQTLGNTIAVNDGASLDDRSMERELDSTFQRDLALMQILARSNNQSASIF